MPRPPYLPPSSACKASCAKKTDPEGSDLREMEKRFMDIIYLFRRPQLLPSLCKAIIPIIRAAVRTAEATVRGQMNLACGAGETARRVYSLSWCFIHARIIIIFYLLPKTKPMACFWLESLKWILCITLHCMITKHIIKLLMGKLLHFAISLIAT